MPINNLTDFIVYIVPGFIATEIYRSFFPSKERNTFSHISWSIVWALIIVLIVNFIDENLLSYSLHTNTENPLSDYRYISALIVSGLLFGLIGSLQLYLRIFIAQKFNCLNWIAPKRDSIWLQINESDVNDWALVTLSDGTKYLGWIKEFKFDPNEKDQEFLLAHSKRVDKELKELYIVNGIGVYLNTSNILSIEFIRGQEKNDEKET